MCLELIYMVFVTWYWIMTNVLHFKLFLNQWKFLHTIKYYSFSVSKRRFSKYPRSLHICQGKGFHIRRQPRSTSRPGTQYISHWDLDISYTRQDLWLLGFISSFMNVQLFNFFLDNIQCLSPQCVTQQISRFCP